MSFFSAILPVASAIAGSIGKGKTPSEVQSSESKSGFASLSPEVQKYMMDTLFPKIKDYASAEYKGMPTRAIDATDTDPVFGSSRRVAFDQAKQFERLRQMQAAEKEKSAAAKGTSDPNIEDVAARYIRSLGDRVRGSGVRGIANTTQKNLWKKIQDGAIDRSALGKALVSAGVDPDRSIDANAVDYGALYRALGV